MLGLRNSWAAMSRLARPSLTRVAIWASRGVSHSGWPAWRLRECSPVARTSAPARSAKALRPIASKASWAVRS